MLEVSDFRGRKLRLISKRAYKPNGSRYVTRSSIASVLRGESNFAVGGSKHKNAVRGWYAHATATRLKIGCHIFTGENFQKIKQWAIS